MQVNERLTRLFEGHPDLIARLGRFLPEMTPTSTDDAGPSSAAPPQASPSLRTTLEWGVR